MKEIPLPSGALLKISHTPFSESKALYQALLEELKEVAVDSKTDLTAMMKNVFCMGFSSKKVEAALSVCLKRCLYNELKIDDQTFEPASAREDYVKVCIEVVEENIRPFLKGLSVELKRVLLMIPSDPR